jgi:hypothetical protein
MFQPLVSGLSVLTNKNEQIVMSNLISDVYEELKFECEAKSYSFDEEEEEEVENEPVQEKDEMKKETDKHDQFSFNEGCYAIILDNNPTPMVVNTQEEARILLSRLILGNNIDISRLQLIKRLPIDFGVLIRE